MKPLIAAIRRLPRRKAGLLGAFLALVTATALLAFPGTASADVLYTGMYRNWLNGGCLDSNDAGNAYVLGCNFGNYQRWRIDHIQNKGYVYGFRIIDVQTGRCLDSNSAGNVYTLTCNGGDFQTWWMYGYSDIKQGWQDKATGRMLSSIGGLTTIPVSSAWDMGNGTVWRPGF